MTGSVAIVAIVAMFLAVVLVRSEGWDTPDSGEPAANVIIQFPPKDQSRLPEIVIIDPNMPLPDRKPSNGN